LSDVLHGEGEPRIVVTDNSNKSELIVVNANYYSVKYFGNINADVENRQVISKNELSKTTTAKILSVNTDEKRIIIDAWSNLQPAAEKSITIENRVIDLPYCNAPGLVEWEELKSKPRKRYRFSKRKKLIIEGVHHYIRLDYTEVIEYKTIKLMQPIYDFSRSEPFKVYPRKDNMWVGYLCEVNPDEVLQYRQLQQHQGHKDISFNFEGIELLEKADLTSNIDDLKKLAGEDFTLLAGEDGTILSGD